MEVTCIYSCSRYVWMFLLELRTRWLYSEEGERERGDQQQQQQQQVHVDGDKNSWQTPLGFNVVESIKYWKNRA